ncbi:MAG TPA: protein kinase, partial [Polyangiales bacterium]|nr:protein kinase [Polyangiales bacterium]
MTSDSTIEVLQGELERLFELDEMVRLSADLLGFDPERIGSTRSKGAFARALVGYCVDQEATEALIDAILLSSSQADAGLRQAAKHAPNGELRPGTRVAGMRIIKKIGEGGLSIVYLAEGESVDGETQRAAIKVIRPQFSRDRAAVHRFTTVNRIMQSLSSPGLAQILGVGQLEDSRPWVAATYLSGQTLAQRIERTGSLHINEARPLFVGVLQGLAALHKRGVLHGDVKVENVFVARGTDGSSDPTGVLVDGGGDRLLTRAPLAAGTTGLLPVLGTAKAIAPEQARGAEPDPRTDIYQVGTLMYETLTGRAPFIGGSAIDVIAQHLSATPQAPSAHARKGWVSAALDEVILRTLAKDPAQRYQSAEALLDALERAIRRPIVQRPLDEGVFQESRRTLLADPANTEQAERVEELAGAAGVLSRAAEVLKEAAGAADDDETRLLLLFRVARIYDIELKDPLRSESAYQRILEIDSGNEVALRGVEAQKRASGDHEGLVGLLLDRIERETDTKSRRALLQEVAGLYEKHLRDPGNALFALSQALITAPGDVELGKQIERLAGNDPARWNELLETLSASAQQTHATLFTDDQTQRAAAADQLELAQQTQADVRATVDAEIASLADAMSQQQAVVHSEVEDAEQLLEGSKLELEAAEAGLDDTARHVGELTEYAQAQRQAAEAGRAQAEGHVNAYEQLEQEAGEAPTPEQQQELARIAAEAEALVAAAEQQEGDSEQAAANLEAARESLAEVQQVLEAAQHRVVEAENRVQAVRERLGVPNAEAGPTSEQRARLTAVEHAVTAAQAALQAFETRDANEAANKREQDLQMLATTYVRMGRWYGERLSRPDFALSCLSQALTVDPSCDPAYDALVDLYRNSQSWPELVATLLQRADRAKSPVRGRDYRAEAAGIIAGKLNDQPQARTQLERVLNDDPEHPEAQKALGDILRDQEDWTALAAVLERRGNALKGQERAELYAQLGELYEDREGDLDRAELKYRAAIEAQPRLLNAWKGLERVSARKDNYEGLVESLRAQVDLAPTPKQRIGLLERIGALLEEEFVDHAQAAECFEDIVSVDAGHEAANAALARLYRHLQRFEDLVEVLDRHAGTVGEPSRKIELMLQAARVFSVDIGSPERAIDLYEDVLHIDEQQNEALTEVARLKSTAGDVGAAVTAVERLADQEYDPQKRAQLFVRAGKLLADSGNRDGAIERYKKALDLDPHLVEAIEALRDIYKQRGDARGAADMVLHAIQIADGDLRRAALLAELGGLYRDQLDAAKEAQEAYEQA